MAFKGQLTIDGFISVKQFWPTGKSDGDTVTLTLPKGTSPFRFRKTLSAPAKVTHAFDTALSGDSSTFNKKFSTKVVTNVAGAANVGVRHVKVRMQGIDTSELHFKLYSGKDVAKLFPDETDPVKRKGLRTKVNVEYYQPLSASAATALKNLIESIGPGDLLPCQFRTRVDTPDQAIDKYGRLVGDVFVQVGGTEANLNNAMLANGMAFPAFYETMLNSEIKEKLDLFTNVGANVPGRVHALFRKTTGTVKRALLYDTITAKAQTTPFQLGDDKGPVILPKMFRRLTAWTILRDGKATPANAPAKFDDYLRKDRSLKDILLTSEVLSGKRTKHDFFNFYSAGKLNIAPREMVFLEALSFLFNPDGSAVKIW